MWPVIVRELRSAGRSAGNYWLRSLASGIACVIAMMAGLLTLGTTSTGKEVFAALHITMFCAIWVLVPLVAADCLSRERREQTLGLLFLTPLKAWHITIAKTLAQSLRGLMLWLAALPVVVIPLLMGGVTGKEVVLSILINGSSFCLALAAGVSASSRSTLFHRSVIAALCTAAILFFGFLAINFQIFLTIFPVPKPPRLTFLDVQIISFMLMGNLKNAWSLLSQNAGLSLSAWVKALAWLLGTCTLVLSFVIWRASRLLRTTWQVGASRSRWARWREQFCTPVLFRKVYRRWLQWSLTSNPVGWLEHRMWSSRITRWAWLALMTAIYGFILLDDSLVRHRFTDMQVLLAAGLMVSALLSAAASFRRERENGVLTLLLVSPLRVQQIVGGRVRALWGQYVPALALLFGAWIYLYRSLGYGRDLFWVGFFVVAFLCVPVIGLYCSLWQQTFFSALLWTALLGVLIPLAISVIVVPVAGGEPLELHLNGARPLVLGLAALGQLAIAATCLVLLLRKLSRRSFTLQAV